MKLKLKDIQEIEERLLLVKENEFFKLNFGEYNALCSQLAKIGRITDLYFELVSKYEEYLRNQGCFNSDEILEKLYDYNNKLKNDEVEVDFTDVSSFVSLRKHVGCLP